MLRAYRILARILRLLDCLFGGLACAALVGIVAVVIRQIVGRYALPQSPVWTEELSRYLFAYAIVFASGSVIIGDRHVKLEVFQHRISRRNAAVLTILTHVAICVFAGLILPHAWRYTMIGRMQTSPALGIKMSWIFGSTLVFFGLTAVLSLMAAARAWLAYQTREAR